MFNIYKYAQKVWDWNFGWIPAYILYLIICCSIWLYVDSEFPNHINLIAAFGITISGFLLFVPLWFLTTRRAVLPSNQLVTIAIAISVDDDQPISELKIIVKKVIRRLQSDYTRLSLRVIVLPIDLITSQSKAEKYLGLNYRSLNGLLYCELQSGKEAALDKLAFKKITYLIKTEEVQERMRIYYEEMHLERDLKLTSFNKDWVYVSDESFNDRGKLSDNLVSTILHVAGLYAIIIDRPKQAIEILKTVYTPKLREFEVKAGEKLSIKMTPKSVVAARLATLLIDLYSRYGHMEFERRNMEEALSALKECDHFLGKHKYSFHNYIGMARISFELDDLEGAKYYTDLAKNINPMHTNVILNEGWFYVIECDPYKVAEMYSLLFKRDFGSGVKPTDLVDFWDRYKPRYPESDKLFEFLEGFVTKLYLDSESGNELLAKFVKSTEDEKAYKKLRELAVKVARRGNLDIQVEQNRVFTKRERQKTKRKNAKDAIGIIKTP